VNARDPAAAPLGTPEEAAATPVPRAMAPHAREAETTPEPATDPERSNKDATWSGVQI